ncbi:pheromone-processing carboxypeptidase KEX1-like [Cynara cardunculus var. scolymus]|uniref:pheromone-processing carboxypeptidase KEX1-like n=1 Tax=Cynara cardunculus var. scolymus TaxID=59895 RepID=UPI000D62A190|nr:pheromone-processing carboxypeptidase KEX1-like [Cynara cardunculus var. scolymus]
MDRVAEFNLLQVEALSNLEPHTKDLSQCFNDLASSVVDDKEGEKYLLAEPEAKVVVAAKAEVSPQTVIPQSEDVITFDEAEADVEAQDDDGAVIAPNIDEDLPITFAVNVSDDEDEDDEDTPLPHDGCDLGDDDDKDKDDNDNFIIHITQDQH